MDFNDIEERVQRIYRTIGKLSDKEIQEHVNIKNQSTIDGNWTVYSFDKKYDDTECKVRVLSVILNLANIKDHLKNIAGKKNIGAESIEEEVKQSLELQLILDLSNAEKHGYPLTRIRHSKMDPVIKNLRQSLAVSNGSVTIDFTGKILQQKGNSRVVINAEIFDKENNKICELGVLINNAVNKWEEIIKKYDLAAKI